MKTLLFFLCAALTAIVTEAQQNSETRLPRSVEFIIPQSSNLFARTVNNVIVLGATTNEIFATANRFGANVPAGSTNRFNNVPLTNAVFGRDSVLIGPVFAAPNITFTPTGRSSGLDGLPVGPTRDPFLTNDFFTNAIRASFLTNILTGLPVQEFGVPAAPLIAVPGAIGMAPLAPPTPPNPPRATTPSTFPNPNAAPPVPSSPTLTPPATTPLTPPGGAAAPAPPAPAPPAPAGGTR
jgi:hypothetical protein